MNDPTICQLAAAAYLAAPTWASDDVHAVRTDFDGLLTVIAFRGTVPSLLRDWLRDLNIIPTWRKRIGWCHRGFMQGAELVFPALLAGTAGRQVILTGHSLGGALAVATAALLTRAGRPPAALVTFGAPRVGLWRMRRLLRKVTVRQYCDGDDPVPCVPRPYLHMRKLIRVGVDLPNPIAAHALSRYAELVTAAAA